MSPERLRSPEALAGGAHCPDELTLAALCDGALDEAEALEHLAHLAQCDRCAALVDAGLHERRAADGGAALDGGAARELAAELEPLVAGPRRWRLRLLPALGGLAAAALVVVSLVGVLGGESVARHARIERLDLRVRRDAAPPEGFLGHRAAGLEAYVEGRDAEAVEALDAALAAGSSPREVEEVELVRASALLLLDRRDAAAAAFARLQASADPDVSDEARWQMAQLHLLEERADAARALLGELVDGGPRARDAAAQLAELDGSERD